MALRGALTQNARRFDAPKIQCPPKVGDGLLGGTPAQTTRLAGTSSRGIRKPSGLGLGVSSEALRTSKDSRTGYVQEPSPGQPFGLHLQSYHLVPSSSDSEERTGPAQTGRPRRDSPSGACLSDARRNALSSSHRRARGGMPMQPRGGDP